ncbi:MAG: secretin N-terminal domain-containing protein [Candidatus Babeliales bacterium]|nr:secretin N-terminal domain-containing protein [Candidatus Babeliales bacterium]
MIKLFMCLFFLTSYLICDAPKNEVVICKQKKILFNEKDEPEDLAILIGKLAKLSNINILFPQDEKFSVKLNYPQTEVTLDEAWNIVLNALDIAGYSRVKKRDEYQIVNNTNVLKQPLEVYINIDPEKLPGTVQRIRYLYYFQNITLTANSPVLTNLDQILKDMLTPEPEGNYLLDPATNSLLISHRSNDIKGVMRIISELDKTGFRETIEVIPLLHTNADYISKIITQLVAPPEDQKFGFFPKQQKAGLYFSENTKVVGIDRINAVAILGPNDSVQRVKKFIVKHLDKPIESAKSVIHVRPLEYIDATDIAPIIQNIIKAKSAGAQAESKDELSSAIIIAEQQVTTEGLKPTVSGEPSATTGADQPQTDQAVTLSTGSNSLIVAAREQDWREIKKLIDQLDVPQMQVAVEILIVQLDLQDNKDVGSQLRNIVNNGQPQNFNFQLGNLESPFLNYNADGTPNFAQGLAADLLEPSPAGIVFANSEPPPVNFVDPALDQPGTFWASVADGNGIAYVYHQLNNIVHNKVLSNPYIIVKNNVQATITNEQLQFFTGPVSVASAAAVVVKQQPISEGLVIDIKPRISDADTVSLELSVKINAFQELIQNTIVKREFRSNVYLKDKEVFAFGGMLTDDDRQSESKLPLFERIPLIGWLFKRRVSFKEKTVLYTFISPTIIRPKRGGGISDFSKDKVNVLKNTLRECEQALLGTNFERLKDPITKFFLPTGYNEFNYKIDTFATDNTHASPLDKAGTAQNTPEKAA